MIDLVTLVKCTFHSHSVALSAQLNLGNWSELQSHLAEQESSVDNGFRNAGLGETQVGRGSAKPGSASGEDRRWQKGAANERFCDDWWTC